MTPRRGSRPSGARGRSPGRPRVVPRPRDAVAVLLALLVGASACTAPGPVPTAPGPTATAPGPTAPRTSPPPTPTPNPEGGSEDALVEVVRRVAPAVVNVTTDRLQQGPFGIEEGEGVGTGFIIRSDGVIVTNFHVVEGATQIKVILPPPDRRTFLARVIGSSSEHDLAVLKVDGRDLPTLPLGRSSDLQLGERVVALGYALALEGGPTVTAGIISSLARTVRVQDPAAGVVRTLEGVLQTDAAINPGNSGGPLVDMAGNVVGINTAGAQTAENIGFAIAIDAVRPIIDRALERPQAPLPYLGVVTTTVDPGLAFQLGLPVDRGALVQAVTGPAEAAGIRVGDVIVSLGQEPVESSEELGRAILARQPGDRVDVGVVRPDGTRATLRVTLGVRPLPTA
jgi:S1-C subfamily serine protease